MKTVKKARIDGIDLSDYQASLKIDWPEAKKAGVKYVIHKATEGTGWTDPAYADRRAEAKSNGVLFGSYHFAHPQVGNAKAEAEAFLKFAAPAPGDLAPALDLEVNEHNMSEAQLTTWVAEWFKVVFAALKIEKGFLYTRFNLRSKPKGVVLWVARYNNDNARPVVPQPFKTWAMWQFTDGKYGVPSAVPGVGRVDADTLHLMFKWVRLRNFVLPLPPKPKPVVARKPARPRKPKPAPESPISRLVRIADSQVGYHEGRSGGHWNNIQKYSPAVPGLEWSQGQAWCCTFVSWCAMKAGLASLFPRTASCKEAMAWWKARNQFHEYPAIGAQVIYGNGEHTGIVRDYDDTYIYVDEGNTNNNGSAEGDGVYLKKRLRRDPYVTGYGYPAVIGGLKSADPNYKRSK